MRAPAHTQTLNPTKRCMLSRTAASRDSHVALHHVEWHPSYRLETLLQTSGAALQAK